MRRRRRGIGRATALRVAREGADVACLDVARRDDSFPRHDLVSADELDEVVAETEAMGQRALAVRADVSDWDAVHAAVGEVVDTLGRVDLVANVAGGASFGMGAGALLMVGEAEWDRVLDVNLKGTWIVSRACAQRMIAAGTGGLDAWSAREIPIGRLQTADDVAATIAFLMSDDGAYITGEAVNVSGGQTMV